MMDTHLLLSLPGTELLEKFGAGEHKPGSGSAAALEGLLSAQLIMTVISLTLDPKRLHAYSAWREELEAANREIRNRIYPKLEELFRKDSEEFDKAIKLRRKRDNATDPAERDQLSSMASEALIPATELPLQIGDLCVELAEYATLVFDHGFRSARGDSGVALNGAISAVAGCLSIVDLNLLTFKPDAWTAYIDQRVKAIREIYVQLQGESDIRIGLLRQEVTEHFTYQEEIGPYAEKHFAGKSYSAAEIEELVIGLQNLIWKYRKKIWKEAASDEPIKLLIPEKIIKQIGYQYITKPSLGQHQIQGKMYDIAGIINNDKREIEISDQFKIESQRFTAAHELGHAIMHNQVVLHRDREMDGSSTASKNNITEYQADKFATYFLMPRKQVLRMFRSIFLTDKFAINKDTAYALDREYAADIKSRYNSLRKLSRRLASADYYNDVRVQPLATIFGVSVEAMAIRLEELQVIEY